jgi:hypothetical protein
MSEKLGISSKVRNPGSIANDQHVDTAKAQKNIQGTGVIDKIIAPSSTATPVPNDAVIRVCNTSGSIQYVYVGPENTVPGTVDATNSFALPAGSVDHIFCGQADDDKYSIMVKTSANSVQVVLLKA